ncbi:trypsin-like serine protease with C-terminal PDZ domain [Saccharomonospora marina XMU15]|uniref:Trypsin-like serine protease with C-terminal PDZ domain n=1 Tax=Saccharomonospora marina XMU15 TaxID=882083 RepID=H5WWY1_9PSEU|nr:trypsin-like peptidase domain-containing protein [Saccharomonospora marina]EHR52809.1 trypsin-like serine protease with C-terminal PDZ domain [Saccharomonospora marina XMU15]
MTDNDPYAQDKPGGQAPGTPEQGGWGAQQEPSPWSARGHAMHGYNPYQPSRYPAASTMPGGEPPSPQRNRRGGTAKLVAGVAMLALLVGGGAGTVGGYLAADNAATGSSVNALNEPLPAKDTGSAPAGSVEAVAQKLMPSVVQLQVRGRSSAGEGSGFVISDDGYILTNNHVIEGAADGGAINVVFQNGDEAEATIVGRDPTTDIAVVKAEGVSGLPTVELGRSDDLRVGESVVAIGSPFELAGTVTAGIVSSLHRPVTAGGQGDQTTVMDAIQTDAAINPGNSGGPLANMQGQVIGINSAIYSPQSSGIPGMQSEGGNVGIGFAIPIDQARRTADDIIKSGHATQTYIGATVGDAPSGGAVIGEVQPGSPAEKAGLKSGDVIVKLGDRRIDDANTLVAAIRTRAPGETVTITLGSNRTLDITLGGQPVQPN